MICTSTWDIYFCALLTFFGDIDAVFCVIYKNNVFENLKKNLTMFMVVFG